MVLANNTAKQAYQFGQLWFVLKIIISTNFYRQSEMLNGYYYLQQIQASCEHRQIFFQMTWVYTIHTLHSYSWPTFYEGKPPWKWGAIQTCYLKLLHLSKIRARDKCHENYWLFQLLACITQMDISGWWLLEENLDNFYRIEPLFD